MTSEKATVSEQHQKVIQDLRATVMHGLGFRRRDLERPLIAVVHGWSEISPGHFHLRPLAESAKLGVALGGGVPAEIPVPGICGSASGGAPSFRYNLPYRDVAAAMVEVMVGLNRFDGAVFIPTCDNVVPAYLMAAARLNLPSIFLTGGVARPGRGPEGRPVTIMDTQRYHGWHLHGDVSSSDLDLVICQGCSGPGACAEMGTATTINGITETLGMSMPGNATMLADRAELLRLARTVGERSVALVRERIRPADIMTEKALHNAIRMVLAVGGSLNVMIHLAALAHELDLDLPLELWDRLNATTPLLCRVRPNTYEYTVVDLARAGGFPAVLGEMKELLDTDLPTVTGRSLGENIEGARSLDHRIIRPLENPFAPEGAIAVLKGTLAPQGAVVKQSAVAPEMMVYRGPARVFDSENQAISGLLDGTISPGDVVVIRYEGPKGSPGAMEMMNFAHFVSGLGLDVPVVTDGRYSGTNKGPSIGHVCPEAMEGGPLALVQDGDVIDVDIPGRRLDVLVSEADLAERARVWVPPPPRETKGVLGAYARRSTSLAQGATIF
jgi:dihydroxy-acid dehydratase